MSKFIPGSTGGDNILLRLTDPFEIYGGHILDRIFSKIKKENYPIEKIVDIGSGMCRDLSIVHKYLPLSHKYGIELSNHIINDNNPNFVEIININIENNKFPFADKSIDFFIANQVLEHTKEIFWIIHEITRSLKIGGYLFIGVPNILSLHNRLLMLFGKHPTQYKSYSAHVRTFSKYDFLKFLDICFHGGYKLENFSGSQFYPFPTYISRIMCKLFPNMAFSIFFLLKKVKPYKSQFIDHIEKSKLETNFYIGK